jgi:hypothetical protein
MRNSETCPMRPCGGVDCAEFGATNCQRDHGVGPASVLQCGNCGNRRALGGVDCDTDANDPGCSYYTPFNEADLV